MIKSELCLEPLSDEEEDTGFRIAARYGLDFYITKNEFLVYSDEYGDVRMREATHEEHSMWCKLVSKSHKDILLFSPKEKLEIIPEETYFDQEHVYVHALDFATMRCFVPTILKINSDMGEIKKRCFGIMYNGTKLYVCPYVPMGYYLSADQEISFFSIPEDNSRESLVQWKQSLKENLPVLNYDLRVYKKHFSNLG